MADIEVYGLHGKDRAFEEILGEDEILGAYEILGAEGVSSGAVRGSAAFKAALARNAERRAPIVQKVSPTKKRRWTVALGPDAVPPNSTVTFQVQPQTLFRGEKLINTGDSALFIQGLFVGQKSQLPTFQNPISVATYAPGVLDNELMMDTCDPALFITMQVQNRTADTLTFSMSIIGHAVL